MQTLIKNTTTASDVPNFYSQLYVKLWNNPQIPRS